MADDKSMEQHYAEMDYDAHNNTYGGFLGMLKWGTVLVVIVTIVVMLAIT